MEDAYKIFKDDDRVYLNPIGWGKVIDTSDYDISVEFDNGDIRHISGDVRKLLSFTEYTLEGFSQERPEELPNRGDIVWGKNFDDDTWHIGHFYLLDRNSKSLKYCIASNPTGSKTLWVQQITTFNPYKNEQ